VDGVRNQLLARPRFTADQNGCVRIGDLCDLFIDVTDLFSGPDDVPKFILFLKFTL